MKRTIYGSVAVATLLIAGIPHVALAQSDETPDAPVALEQPMANLGEVTDVDGDRVKVVDTSRSAGEKAVAAVTDDGAPVLLRSLYSTPAPIATLNAAGVVEEVGVDDSYTTDGEPQREQEKTYLADLPQIDPASLELTQTTAVSQTSFSLALADTSLGEYDVFRDDQYLGRTVEGAFTDDKLAPGQNYSYTVTTAADDGLSSQLTYAVTTLASDAAETLRTSDDAVKALAMAPTAQWFLYDTFIANQYANVDLFTVVGGQCVGNIGDKYSGDNRSYRYPSLLEHPWNTRPVRTGAMAKADFANGGAYVFKDKIVGPTKLYSSSNVLKETRTASTAGIKFLEESATANLYQFRISHLVRNPFCTAGAIRYEAYVNIWASGVMQLNGYRHPVPHHEIYGMFTYSNGGQAWIQMYRGANESFLCLGGTCSRQTLSKTYTPG